MAVLNLSSQGLCAVNVPCKLVAESDILHFSKPRYSHNYNLLTWYILDVSETHNYLILISYMAIFSSFSCYNLKIDS